MSKTNGRIESFQALRALAFLGIFLAHAGASVFRWAALGVSIFFVLSGYLMYYHHGGQDMECSLKKNIVFSWGKIKKLYPLHIITMCFAVVLSLALFGFSIGHLKHLVLEIALNVTLLQTWVPDSDINTCLNGVAWYLSAMVFLYVAFPYVKKKIDVTDSNKLIIVCALILAAEIIVSTPLVATLGENSKVYTWFTYGFPVFRLGDFFIGCCFAKIWKTKQPGDLTATKATIFEVLATLLTIAVYMWAGMNFENPFLIATQNNTTLYIPLAVIWVLLFSNKQGIITKLLTNKVTVFVGNISAYTYLIHYVITQYVSGIFSKLQLEVSGMEMVLVIVAELLLTIGLAVLYDKCVRRKKKRI